MHHACYKVYAPNMHWKKTLNNFVFALKKKSRMQWRKDIARPSREYSFQFLFIQAYTRTYADTGLHRLHSKTPCTGGWFHGRVLWHVLDMHPSKSSHALYVIHRPHKPLQSALHCLLLAICHCRCPVTWFVGDQDSTRTCVGFNVFKIGLTTVILSVYKIKKFEMSGTYITHEGRGSINTNILIRP